MARNLKALGLALVTVFALSALIAVQAQAETETAELSWGESTVKLTGEEDPSTPINILQIKTKPGGTVKFECDEPHFEVTNLTNHKTLRALNINYSDAATTPANPSTCTGTAGAKVPVKMNGCEYEFHAGTTIKEQTAKVDGESEGTVDIVCPAGKEIVVEGPGCTARIKAQTGLGPVYYETETSTPESVTIEALVGTTEATHNKSIIYSTEGVICGVQSNVANGVYTGNSTVTGLDTNNKKTNATVGPVPPETETAELSWGESTVKLTGEEDPSTPINILQIKTKPGGTVKFECDEPHFEVTNLTNHKTLRALNINYSDAATTPGNPSTCTGPSGAKVPVKMNGCEYEFHAGTTIKEQTAEIDAESEGTVDIVCPAGKEIVVEGPGCTTRIKAQTHLGPVYYETETSTPESVTIEALVGTTEATHNKSLTYSTEGITCGVQNNITDGVYTGNATVTGLDTNNKKTNATVGPVPSETETAELSWGAGTVRLAAEEDPPTPIQILTIKTKPGGTVKFECDEPTAEVTNLTNHKTLRALNIDYSDVATTPANPSTCTGTAGAKVPVKMNGCEYEFHAGTTIKEQTAKVDGESEGWVDIVCPEGKEIVVEGPGCTTRIKAQTHLGPVYYETETSTPESVTIEALVGTAKTIHTKSITYSTEGIICGTQTSIKGGTYTGNATLTGFDAENNRTGVTVT